MAGEKISHGGYELDRQQQLDLGRKLDGLMQDCLSMSNARLSFPVTSPNKLRDGRFVFFVFLKDKDGQKDRVFEEMKMVIAASGDSVRDQLKSEFPELRKVEFELNSDGSGLVVTCTLDEMVDSAPETVDEEVHRLAAGFGAVDLGRRLAMAESALIVKGRKLFDNLGISGIELVRAGCPNPEGQVICAVRCKADAFSAFDRKMSDFRIRHYSLDHPDEAPSHEWSCIVSPEIFDSGVWPEVGGVVGGVAGKVAEVVGGSHES